MLRDVASSRSLLGTRDELEPADFVSLQPVQTIRDARQTVREHLDPVRLVPKSGNQTNFHFIFFKQKCSALTYHNHASLEPSRESLRHL